ncbi:MAG: hypothetical protein WCO60_19710 [Verrucomicrobiota bacterium]
MSGPIPVLTGKDKEKYGPLPKIELPDDGVRLREVSQLVLQAVKDKGLYRMDNVIVVNYDEESRFDTMDPDTFRTWAEEHVAFVKSREDQNKIKYEVCRSMPIDVSRGILASREFWPKLPAIERQDKVRLPVCNGNWEAISLLPVGYSSEYKAYTFGVN